MHQEQESVVFFWHVYVLVIALVFGVFEVFL